MKRTQIQNKSVPKEEKRMKCDCREELHSGAVLTELGNDIEYSECGSCGIVEVMGMDVEDKDVS